MRHRAIYFHGFMLLLLLVLGACEQQMTQENTRALETVTENTPSYWPEHKLAIRLSVSQAFTQEEKTYIKDMAYAWEDAGYAPGAIFSFGDDINEKGSANMQSYEDSTIGVYRVNQWPTSLPASALAVTQIIGIQKGQGEHLRVEIQHADILFNYDNFEFTTQYSWGFDFQTVILHELGHLLGLAHDDSSAQNSVMYPSISKYLENRAPKERDLKALAARYPYLRTQSAQSLDEKKFALRESLVNRSEDVTESNSRKIVIHRYLMCDGTEEIKTFAHQ